jgi:hypothetical protein
MARSRQRLGQEAPLIDDHQDEIAQSHSLPLPTRGRPATINAAATMPATTYEFFVSNGAPKPATRAIRSHAMRTALQQRKSAGVAAASSTAVQPPQGSAAESQRTAQHKDDLKGRFRLATAARRTGTKHSAADKEAAARESGSASRKLKRYRIAGKAPTLSELYALEGRGDLEDRDAEIIQMLTSDGASEIEWLGSDRADPFGVMPVEANWRVDMLVKYCKSTHISGTPTVLRCARNFDLTFSTQF